MQDHNSTSDRACAAILQKSSNFVNCGLSADSGCPSSPLAISYTGYIAMQIVRQRDVYDRPHEGLVIHVQR